MRACAEAQGEEHGDLEAAEPQEEVVEALWGDEAAASAAAFSCCSILLASDSVRLVLLRSEGVEPQRWIVRLKGMLRRPQTVMPF